MLVDVVRNLKNHNKSIKLHLGCGHQKFTDYINIDGEYMSYDPDIIIHDITKPFPLEDNSVDEILTVHVVEHLSRQYPPVMFKEFNRICKKGGIVAMEWPDLLKMCQEVVNNPDCFWSHDKRLIKRTVSGIYGDFARYPDPTMLHKWGYSTESMIRLLKEAGFSRVYSEANHHAKSSIDSRVVAVK